MQSLITELLFPIMLCIRNTLNVSTVLVVCVPLLLAFYMRLKASMQRLLAHRRQLLPRQRRILKLQRLQESLVEDQIRTPDTVNPSHRHGHPQY